MFGPPIDYSDLCAEKPRPTLYKKCADRFMAEVGKLAEREQVLRAELAAGRRSPTTIRAGSTTARSASCTRAKAATDARRRHRPVSRLYARERRD